ncbi:MAG: hypothetical protein ABIS16_04955 [Sphingomicrobium sp.]
MALALAACNQQEAAENNAPAAEAAAADALSGTWKVDLASLKFEGKPDDYLLQGGTYKCSTCIPPLTVAADGQFHPVADRPYYDSMSVTTVDPRTVEIRRRKGDKEVSSARLQVSEDGNLLTTKFTDATTPNAPPIEGSATAKRAGPPPAGAHAISGQWTPDRIADYSEDALNTTYRFDGNSVTSTAQGQTWTAEIGGAAVPVKGDIGGTTVAVAREGTGGLRETYTRDGKQVGIVTVVPSADGKTFTFTNSDPRDGSKTSWTATKTS